MAGAVAMMYFHIEERRAWVRSQTHTVVIDRHPDFERLAKDPSGKVRLLLRIWLAEDRGEGWLLRDYLGTVSFCDRGPSVRNLRRLFSFASASARKAGVRASALRRELGDILRDYMRRECGKTG